MGLDDAPDDGEPEAGAFGFGGAEHGAEGTGLLFLGHSLARILEIDAHHGRGRGIGRGGLEAGPDDECSAEGHGFGRVEDQVEEHLVQLTGVGHDGGQVGSEAVLHAYALVGELVAGEQRQLLKQGIDLDGGEVWLGAAREDEDLFDDLVQVLDLAAHDFRVAGPRVAFGETQIERVIKHLHHRERIADFMGDLGGEQAEGGKFLIAPHPFLDLDDVLVEPGFLDGHG